MEDCGECRFCLNKVIFGGNGSLKAACVQKQVARKEAVKLAKLTDGGGAPVREAKKRPRPASLAEAADDEDLLDGEAFVKKAKPEPKKPPRPTPVIKPAKKKKLEATVMDGNTRIEAVLTALGARPASEFTCSIISKGRPNNVQANLALFSGTGVTPNFVVGAGEAELYRAQGAVHVVEGGGLCASRNRCIDLAAEAGNLPPPPPHRLMMLPPTFPRPCV